MADSKKYPVKILEDLYVLDVASPRGFEKEEFLTLSEIERIEFLIFKNPSFSYKEIGQDKREIYTSSFDNFIISIFEERPLKFSDSNSAERKSEELFKILNNEYLKMISAGYNLERTIKFSKPFE